MKYDMPVDMQILIDNKCSGSDYSVYLYVRHKMITAGLKAGLELSDLKHGYDPKKYEGFFGISRTEIRSGTQYSLKQISNAIQRLKELDLLVPDNGDNGRYYYPIHFRLPFIEADNGCRGEG